MNAAQNPQAQPQATGSGKGSIDYKDAYYYYLNVSSSARAENKHLREQNTALVLAIKRYEHVDALDGIDEILAKLKLSRDTNATLREIDSRKSETIQKLQNELRETRLQCAILASEGTLRRNRNDNAPTGLEITIAANPDTVSSEPNTPFDKWVEKKPSKDLKRPQAGSPAALRNERVFQMEPPK